MSQTKYKLRDDLKAICINWVRGYKHRVREYHQKRSEVINATPPPNIETTTDWQGNEVGEFRGRSGTIGDSVFDKNVRLEEIEGEPDAIIIKAVEQAKLTIGADIISDTQRQRLIDAIWDSCIEGRNFEFEQHDLPMGKTNFYERRREFLWTMDKLFSDFMKRANCATKKQ